MFTGFFPQNPKQTSIDNAAMVIPVKGSFGMEVKAHKGKLVDIVGSPEIVEVVE